MTLLKKILFFAAGAVFVLAIWGGTSLWKNFRNTREVFAVPPTVLDTIRVENPAPEAILTNLFPIKGMARGNWFFEAIFGATLYGGPNNDVLGRAMLTAQREWMTPEFIPFEGTMEFQNPAGFAEGTLELNADNPSDQREFDKKLIIPVRFR